MKNFLNISDFAKISGVSRQTLIYYDRIGLFSPAYIADNKYRMYSHNQVNNISIITILSDLGVPLKKIKEIVSNISIETMTTTLNYQLNVIQEKIEKLSLLKDMMQIRLEQIEEGKKFLTEFNNFCVKEFLQDTPIRVGNEINRNLENIGDESVIEFFKSIEKLGLPVIFSFGHIKNSSNILQNDYDTVSNLWFKLKNRKHANAFIPAGKYLIAYTKGDYGKTNYIYPELLSYAKENGYEICGEVYEEYLIDELSEKGPNEFVLQVRVKIK